MSKTQKGFTLIELLIVVAIIGILASIAIPNLLTAMQRSKQKRTMADMRTIGTAWERHANRRERYQAGCRKPPGHTKTVEHLMSFLSPTYCQTFPRSHDWSNE